MIQRVQTKQKQSPAGGLLSDTGRRRGGGSNCPEGGTEGGWVSQTPGGGGGARRSQSAPHIHVLVCICSNVEAVHSAL